MRKLLLAGAATIGIIAAPAVLSAQDAPELQTSANAAADVELTAEQRAMYDAWPDDRRATYDALEQEHQTYFWTLTPKQRDAYWFLTPQQRTQIMGMTPEARASAWTSIEAQIAAQANDSQTSVGASTSVDASASAQTANQANARAVPPPSSTTVVDEGDPATPATVVRTNPGNLTPPPASAQNKTYPVCTAKVQDNCQNPGEGGAPGRSRALQHWPGEPASERD
ncbi:hypothetical protein GRI75_04850 [Altererythrobacter soli]|uniref:Uncharacterized protein n=1 Tax=Croceibacterium soli TaxID=1739690 RepID=A0A6I4UQ79_9SPHN|nr:hypothetical protein [Croceibacterium soli]MXP40972.1 hypothetical protein [Croceibacterium soli]